MKQKTTIFYLLFIVLFHLLFISGIRANKPVPGKVYYGKATFYSNRFIGKRTISGERYDVNKYTAAHRSFPMNTLIRVTNISNNKFVIVKINDRCRNRKLIDLSRIAADKIDILGKGVVKVSMEILHDTLYPIWENQELLAEALLDPEIKEDSTLFANSEFDNARFSIRVTTTKTKKEAQKVLRQLPSAYKQMAKILPFKYKKKLFYKITVGPFGGKQSVKIAQKAIRRKFREAKIYRQ